MTERRTWKPWSLAAAGIGLAVAVLLVGGEGPTVALVNESPSLPRGLYLRTGGALEHGSVVAIGQPQAARPYLARLGMPRDVLLLKRVAAVGGERVCAEGGWIRTPERQVRALGQDRLGSTLPVWRECRVLAGDELFLLGDTPGSFDSRYFGPVMRDEAAGIYREILTW